MPTEEVPIWTLFVIIPGMLHPMAIHGYTSKKWAEDNHTVDAANTNGWIWWVDKLPRSKRDTRCESFD